MNYQRIISRLLVVTVLSSAANTAYAQTLQSEILQDLAFREIGPINMSGRIVDIAVVESNPFTFYIAAATGGVWKTGNNGVTLEPVFYKQATISVVRRAAMNS